MSITVHQATLSDSKETLCNANLSHFDEKQTSLTVFDGPDVTTTT